MESHKNNGMWDIIPDMAAEKKKVKQEGSLLSTGVSSIIFGALCSAMYPDPLFMYGGYGLGAFSIGYHFLTARESKENSLFKNIGLQNKDEDQPRRLSKRKTNYGVEYRYSIPKGMNLSDFASCKESLQVHFKNPVKFEYDNNYNAVVKVYEKTLKKLYPFTLKETKGLKVLIGYGYGDIPIYLDIENAPHVMIAGATNQGKSVILTDILMALVHYKKAKIDIIDLKGNEFLTFKDHVENLVTELPQAEKLLSEIKAEMDHRFKLLRQNNCKNIREYNKKKKSKLPYKVLIIDEYADLAVKEAKKCQEIVRALSQKARASGIHLILATQRDSSDIIDGFVKNNIPTVIALRTSNRTSSQVILDRPGAEELTGNGHFILKCGADEQEGRSMFITNEDCEKLLKPKRHSENAVFVPKKEIKDFDFLE